MNNDFKILVVDDTPELLDITTRALKKADYKIYTAVTGTECIEVVSKEKPDLILLDVMLPDSMGTDIARTLKKDPLFSSIYVILISSINTLSEHVSEGLEKGADGYIVRPVESRELLARVEAACRIIQAERELERAFIISWKTTFDSVNEALFLLDTKGVIKQVNKRGIVFLKKTEDEIIGYFCHDIMPCPLNSTDNCVFVRMEESKKRESEIVQIGEKWFELVVDPLYDEIGEIIGSVHIMNDYTERRQVDEKLVLASKKAEESQRLKKAFLANLSHEIRTPMNGIMGFAELLKRPDLSTDQQKEFIRVIEKSGYRMLDTIKNIVEMAKIDSGLVDLCLSDVNINAQIEEIHTFFKNQTDKKGIEFEITGTVVKQDNIIETDREKIHFILSNLVINAIKYTSKGRIEIGCTSATLPQLDTDKDQSDPMSSVSASNTKYSDINPVFNRELLFFVKDTGIGIPFDRQLAVFESFVQADIEDKAAIQGLGLGLSISKAYADMLGGKLWMKSREGGGSTFYFSLPVKKQ